MKMEFDQGASDRGCTPALWAGFNEQENKNAPRYVKMDIFEDYHNLHADDFTLTQYNSAGTALCDTSVADIGVLLIDSGSTSDFRGPQIQYTGQNTIVTTSNIVAFEMRAKVTANTTPGSLYGGLAIIDTSLFATGSPDTFTASDWLGFLGLSSASVVFGGEDGSRDTITFATASTTYQKWGFRVEYGVLKLVTLDGAKVDISGFDNAALPDGLVCPSFGMISSGTTQPVLNLDWYRFGVI